MWGPEQSVQTESNDLMRERVLFRELGGSPSPSPLMQRECVCTLCVCLYIYRHLSRLYACAFQWIEFKVRRWHWWIVQFLMKKFLFVFIGKQGPVSYEVFPHFFFDSSITFPCRFLHVPWFLLFPISSFFLFWFLPNPKSPYLVFKKKKFDYDLVKRRLSKCAYHLLNTTQREIIYVLLCGRTLGIFLLVKMTLIRYIFPFFIYWRSFPVLSHPFFLIML